MKALIFCFLSLSAFALQAQEVSISSSSVSGENKKNWGGKIEMEAKSLSDKRGTVHGYSLEAEAHLHRMMNEHWGFTGGLQVTHEDRENRIRLTELQELSFGLRTLAEIAGLRWKGLWLYNHFFEENEDKFSFLVVDIRTQIYLTTAAKARLRFKHTEYFFHEDLKDLRQSKLEFSPALLFARWAWGVRQELQHRVEKTTTVNSLDLSPFIKYEGRTFEPLVKVDYRLVDEKNGFVLARNWEQKPTYSFELEMTF